MDEEETEELDEEEADEEVAELVGVEEEAGLEETSELLPCPQPVRRTERPTILKDFFRNVFILCFLS
jgi:hypothetical protein